MHDHPTLSRRRFLQAGAATAGALVIGFHLPTGGRRAGASETAELVNAWLRIDPDGRITIQVPSSEMGQGVYTSMPMLVAEELEVDWRAVRAEMAPVGSQYVNRIFNLQATGGSTSIRWSFEPLRRVGAQARELLRRAAAERWGVDPGECRAENGQIVSVTGERLGYGELAAAASRLELPQEVTLKPMADWRLLGTAAPRLDVPAKTSGTAGFGIDVELEGMLIGTVRACPTFGGRLKSVDQQPALAVDGVRQVVTLDDAVIVLADGYWPALQGLEALQPEWDRGEHAGNDSAAINRRLHQGLEAGEAAIARADGDVATTLADAARTVEATYEVPFLAHATMEPMNATVRIDGDRVEVWAPTQGQGLIPMVLGQVLGVDPAQVTVHTTFLGGGFGRRFETDFVIQAALAARAAGAPVKLIWSREEDTRHDFYRTSAVARLRAGLDGDGRTQALDVRLVCPSIWARVDPRNIHDGVDDQSVEGCADSPYRPAHMRVEYVQQDVGVPVGFWRSVGHSQNAFFMEGFVDELAHETGRDPVALRRELLAGSERHLRVLDRLVALGGWGRAGEGRFQGLALHTSFETLVGQIVELSVTDDRRFRLHKVSCVLDCGVVINPDTIEAQIESSIVYGLTAALYGEITIADGAVEQGNFDDYPMLRLAQMPAVASEIIATGDRPGGIGEPALPPIAPALVNALFAATGQRIRSLPLRKHGFEPA
ncbi:MAG: xanthine dehydrogenase family protein molybdopterin-binding subunit [Candidatus Competibacterales bacterium]|nr:xanthine dehydrogenase family protein molybdopterin-binding subunit [Candidatus Competibacterales bacterium]